MSDIDFVSGSGCELVDAAGRRYLDLESGVWCTPLGHSHPAIVQAIADQAARLAHAGTAYPGSLADRAAEEVLRIAGVGDGAVTFLCSGSEAIALGIAAIRHCTGRRQILTLGGAFYGSLVGPGDPDWVVLDPSTDAAGLDAIDWAKIAGYALEPGGSAIAMLNFPAPQLVSQIARRVQAAGGLVLANEVTTGIGRTGRWLGIEHYDVRPDLVALGKGLGNGYPVSALAVAPAVAERLADGVFRYVQSHQNDPLGAAVATAVLTTIRNEGWIDRVRETGQTLLALLNQVAVGTPAIREVRGRGPLLAVELNPAHGVNATQVHQQLLDHGVVTIALPAGQLIRMDPALVLSTDQAHAAAGAFAAVLA